MFRGDVELAWRTWTLLDATEWKHLPHAGGLLDQDGPLMDDVMSIEFMSRRVKESRDPAGG